MHMYEWGGYMCLMLSRWLCGRGKMPPLEHDAVAVGLFDALPAFTAVMHYAAMLKNMVMR